MTLFEECKQALAANIKILNVEESQECLAMLEKLINHHNVINWDSVEYNDYDDLQHLSKTLHHYDAIVYVLADDKDIPMFQTNLQLVLENFYDVAALSTKVFIFNGNELLFPLFPTEKIRYAHFNLQW